MAYDFTDTIDGFKSSVIIPSDIDVVSVVTEGCPLLTIIATQARQRINGQYNAIGFGERYWTRGYTYFFKEYGDYSEFFTVNGTINSAATTLVLDSTEGIVKGQLLLNPTTGETVRVSAVVSATDLTISRAYGTVAAASITDNEVLVLVSVSTSFGAVGTNEANKVPADQTNYFQKITTTFFRSDLENFSSDPLADMTWENVQKTANMFVYEKTLEHAKQIEKALLFSQKKWDTATTSGSFEGLIRMAIRGGNSTDISGAPTLANLIDDVKECFKNGSPTMKYMLVGEDCDAVLQNMIELYKIQNHGIANYSVNGVDLTFTEITFGGGQKVRIVYHPYMTTESGYGGHALILDPTVLKLVWMKGKTGEGKEVTGTTRLEIVTSESNYANTQYDIVSYLSLHNWNSSASGLVQLV